MPLQWFVVQRRRLRYGELLRETWTLLRRHARPFLILTLLLILPVQILSEGLGRYWETALAGGLFADRPRYVRYLWLSLGTGLVYRWWLALAWGALAGAVLAGMRGEPIVVSSCVRRALRKSWGLLVIVLMVQALYSLAGFAAMFPRVWIFEALTGPDSSFAFRRAVNQGTGEFFSALFVVGAVYVSYAPLALVLEERGLWRSFATAFRRVRGNWLWLSGIALGLWVVWRVFDATTGLLGDSIWSHVMNLTLVPVVRTFLFVARSVPYLNLMAAELPAGDLDPGIPPAAPDRTAPASWAWWS